MSHRILVVDDSRSIRAHLKQLLQDAQFEVDVVESGEAALAQIETQIPNLVTLDVEMPGLNGFQTCEKIRSHSNPAVSSLPVIFLTGNDSFEERKKGFEVGATEFLSKHEVTAKLVVKAKAKLEKLDRFHELTALVVDDISSVRHAIAAALKPLGFHILEADDGTVALEVLKTKDVDIILTDLHMKQMDGDELTRVVRSELGKEEIPIIMITTDTDPNQMIKLFQLGVTDFVNKPFLQEELLARVENRVEALELNRAISGYATKLEKLDRLKQDYMSICVHDLRSPLTSIIGFSELLMEESISDEAKNFADMILSSGKAQLELIDELLDAQKLERLEEEIPKEEIPVSRLVEDGLPSIRNLANTKGIQFEVSNQVDSGLRLTCNLLAMKRVINNFLSNAIKFTQTGGRVTLGLSKVAQELQMTFADTGMGIPEDKKKELFQKYSKLSRRGTNGEKSTGLGLYIVKRLIDGHDGRIDVHSEEGKGTTFTVGIPL